MIVQIRLLCVATFPSVVRSPAAIASAAKYETISRLRRGAAAVSCFSVDNTWYSRVGRAHNQPVPSVRRRNTPAVQARRLDGTIPRPICVADKPQCDTYPTLSARFERLKRPARIAASLHQRES